MLDLLLKSTNSMTPILSTNHCHVCQINHAALFVWLRMYIIQNCMLYGVLWMNANNTN